MSNPEQSNMFGPEAVETNICPECGHVRGEGPNCRICRREQIKQKIHDKFDKPIEKEVSGKGVPFTQRPEIQDLNQRIEEAKKREEKPSRPKKKTA